LHQDPKHLEDGFFKEYAPNKISKKDMDKMMKKASKNIINQQRKISKILINSQDKIFYPISTTNEKLPINTFIANEICRNENENENNYSNKYFVYK